MEAFKEGDMVWVKWKNLWWPSKVLGESSYPSDLELPKDYLAVVRYIGEDDVEVVCCAQNIHHYNSERKEDFLRRGIKTDNTKFKQLFAERVRIAEGLVDGDPDILSKVNLKRINSYIFASPSDSKSKRIKKEAKKLSDSNHDVVTKVMSKKKKGSPQVTRVITHPRFISDKDDHTVRILADSREPAAKEPSTFTEQYRCHQCDFATSRLNNLLSHNQTHSSSPKTAYIVPIPEEAVGSVLKYDASVDEDSDSSIISDSEGTADAYSDYIQKFREVGDVLEESSSDKTTIDHHPIFYENVKEIFASRALRVYLNSLLSGEQICRRQDEWIRNCHNPQLLQQKCCMEFLGVVNFENILLNSEDLLKKLTIFLKRANVDSLESPEMRRSFIFFVLLPEAINYALKKLDIKNLK